MLVFCLQLLRERMMKEYLCKFDGKKVSIGSPLTQSCYCNHTKFLARDTKKQLESERSACSVCKIFFKKVIEMEIIGDRVYESKTSI